MNEHRFCQVLERTVRQDCLVLSSAFSLVGSSLGSRNRQFFVEGPCSFSVYVTACCKWAARAKAYELYVEDEKAKGHVRSA